MKLEEETNKKEKEIKKTQDKVAKAKKWFVDIGEKMTLDEIEALTTKLALEMDNSNFFINSKRIEALNMVAQQKIQRMKIEAMEKGVATQTTVEPIKVEFVSANTVEALERVDRLTKEVEETITVNNSHA